MYYIIIMELSVKLKTKCLVGAKSGPNLNNVINSNMNHKNI